jgi:hypothetical protein
VGREPTGFSKTHNMQCPGGDGDPVDGFESYVETVKAGFPGVFSL